MQTHTGVGHPRWRARALVPALVCLIAGAGLSCQGDCPYLNRPVPDVALRARYVLQRYADTVPLPVVLSDDGRQRVRLLADTLLFANSGVPVPASGTYTEIVVLGVQQAGAGEIATRTAVSHPFGGERSSLTLRGFGGGAAPHDARFDILTATGDPASITEQSPRFHVLWYEAR